jgi:hypothetical protein
MRERWVIRNGELVQVGLDYQAPTGPRLHIIGDSADVVSMADGKRYTSKSRYKAELRARGYEIVGNERPTLQPREIPDAKLDSVLSSVMRGER